MPFNTAGFTSSIQGYLVYLIAAVPALLIALPFHEFSHGLVAYMLGDDTAKRMGRLTLNPLRHLDPLGTICLVVMRFGWAKPVPVNPNNFRHRRSDMALTAIAGPLSNLLLAFVSLFVFSLVETIPGVTYSVVSTIFYFVSSFAGINIALFLFNLIPLPPLDGSRILALILPERIVYSIERLGVLPLLVLVFALSYLISGTISNWTNDIFYAFARFLKL